MIKMFNLYFNEQFNLVLALFAIIHHYKYNKYLLIIDHFKETLISSHKFYYYINLNLNYQIHMAKKKIILIINFLNYNYSNFEHILIHNL